MTFDPRKTVYINANKIRRAQFWYEVRLYLLVSMIVGLPTVLALWLMMEFM